MFKSIKEFFVGKPKVEEKPAECPYKVEAAPEPVPAPVPLVAEATVVASTPVVEEIKPETVFISASDNMNISISTQSDTITLTPPVVDNTVWPFPKAVPEEKKTRTPVKQKEAVTTKKTTPAITANSKSRKKK
jgi:hypothetical protein